MADVIRMFSFEEERDDAARAEAEEKLREATRIAEALLFAASEPMDEGEIARRLAEGTDLNAVMARLKEDYAHRGINLVRVGRKWLFRTASDLGWICRAKRPTKRSSRARLWRRLPSSLITSR